MSLKMRLHTFLLIHLLASTALGAFIPSPHGLLPDLAVRAENSSSSTTIKESTTTAAIATSVFTSKVSSSDSVTSANAVSSQTTTSSLVADAACTHGPETRACWGNGYSIASDFDKKWPSTGRTRRYSLEITNMTMAPDGFERYVLAVNGQYPGPTIIADWGDILEITVKNSMPDNGTSIHWHGIRQWYTNTEDGVPGITECPLAPGDSKVYKFQATQYGTSWYHSHFSGQYGDGVLGGILINGPATSNYDVDLGTYIINDWYYKGIFQVEQAVTASAGPPPAADSALINGSMVSQYGGQYTTNTITKGKKYRLRLINTSVDNMLKVSLDNHQFEVITADFVPIKPYTTDWLFIAVGQRYDVIFEADQTAASYWFRAEAQTGCGANKLNGKILSIFKYEGATSDAPTSSAVPYTQGCIDETSLEPFWDSFVPSDPLTQNVDVLDVAINIGINVSGTVVTWGVNLTALDVQWQDPILEYVLNGSSNWPQSANLIELSQANTWYYWIIQEVPGVVGGVSVPVNVPHPIHLHGHDFYVLGTGIGTFSQTSSVPSLNFDNPTRRDVAMLPAGGWLALAFETNNPGAWLMHCHIAWHVSEGLAVQFLETKEQINVVNPIAPRLTETCKNWNAWYPLHAPYLKTDSGV